MCYWAYNGLIFVFNLATCSVYFYFGRQAIVPGIITPGTLLYGTEVPVITTVPEWTVVYPEWHAYHLRLRQHPRRHHLKPPAAQGCC
jgi:hypothetical protein